MSIKRIVLTGGGTAGHVMPNLALIPYLKDNFDEIHYIGSVGGMEESLVKNYSSDIIYHAIPCVKLRRSLSIKNLAIPFKLLSSVSKAKKLLKQIKPNIIFSKGGFVSLPVCLGAKGICPVILHESDLSMGLSNKLSASKCSKILTSFSTDIKGAIVTGAPLRRELYQGNAEYAKRKLGLQSPLPYLLITGGSQGAKAINEVVESALPTLTKKFNIIHLAGKNNEKDLPYNNYRRLTFSSEMAHLYALADFVLCRGGANTLFEVASLKKPALVIPLPTTASRGDQIDNARYFEKKGACKVLLQENLASETLVKQLDLLVRDKNEIIKSLNLSSLDGTEKIARIIIDTVE